MFKIGVEAFGSARAGHARPLHGVSMGKWDIIIGLRQRINVVGVEFPGTFLLVMTNSFR